jgi:hypothetical protein
MWTRWRAIWADTAIKALKPQAKRYFVTDDRGLSLVQGREIAAENGSDRLKAFWAELTPDERALVGGRSTLSGWQAISAETDERKAKPVVAPARTHATLAKVATIRAPKPGDVELWPGGLCRCFR